MQEEVDVPEIAPYQKLQGIFNEDEKPVLSANGKSVLDDILGKDPEPEKSIFQKFINFFKSIDSKLFPKGPKMTNIYHKRK